MLKVQISTNNGSSWTTLCGKYSTPPPHINGSDPGYEGIQRYWVKEEINLTPYIGNQIKIRFRFTADNYGFDDGIYIDNVLIRKTVNSTYLTHYSAVANNIMVYPTITSGKVNILSGSDDNLTCKIYSADGKCLMMRSFHFQGTEKEIDISELNNGLYFMEIQDENLNEKVFKLIKTD
jgi:hypothetical protein